MRRKIVSRKVRPAKSDRIPARFWSMGCKVAAAEMVKGVGSYALQWVAFLLYEKVGAALYRHTRTITYSEPDGVWPALAFFHNGRSRELIVGRNLAAMLQVTGFFLDVAAGKSAMESQVLLDPPTIIRANVRGRHYTLIDLLNVYNCPTVDILPVKDWELCDKVREAITREPGESEAVMDALAVGTRWMYHLSDLARCNLGDMRPTAASQAYQAWRRVYRGKPVEPHGDDVSKALEREAFYGGRNQALYVGKVADPATAWAARDDSADEPIGERGPVYVCDVTAMYPAVMSINKFPRCLRARVDGMKPVELADLVANESYAVVAEARVNTSSPIVPARRGGKTVYPVGTFWTRLCGPELRECFFRGGVEKVGQVNVYETADLFSGTLSHLWRLRQRCRQAKDQTGEATIKLLMNSLFGRFARWGEEWLPCKCRLSPGGWGVRQMSWGDGHQSWPFRVLGDSIECFAGRWEREDTLPVISAYVASLARLALLEVIRGASPGTVFYCDTDAVHVDGRGYQALRDTFSWDRSKMGTLHLECEGADAEYWGPKKYRVGNRLVLAGLPEGYRPISPGVFSVTRATGMAGLLTREPGNVLPFQTVRVDMRKADTFTSRTPHGWLIPPMLSDPQETPNFEG